MSGFTVLLDLDDTLTNRAGAFDKWATEFLRSLGRPIDEFEVLRSLDNHGLTERHSFFNAVAECLGLSIDIESVLADYRASTRRPQVTHGAIDAIHRIHVSGGTAMVLTNGKSSVQRGKLEYTGLSGVVDRVVISEEVGFAKPDARIFEVALENTSGPEFAWMVGDNFELDICGAARIGIATAWVADDVSTRTSPVEPDIVRATAAMCIDEILSRRRYLS